MKINICIGKCCENRGTGSTVSSMEILYDSDHLPFSKLVILSKVKLITYVDDIAKMNKSIDSLSSLEG